MSNIHGCSYFPFSFSSNFSSLFTYLISHQLKQFHDATEEEEEEEERKREKCRLIQERIEHLTSYLDHVTITSSDHLSQLRKELDWQTRLWQTELESGGNTKFLAPVGGREGHWHRTCTELIKSRFSAANWQVGVASEPGESPVIVGLSREKLKNFFHEINL